MTYVAFAVNFPQKNSVFWRKITPSHAIAQTPCVYCTQRVQICTTDCVLIKGFKQSRSRSVSVSLTLVYEVGCQNIPALTAARPGWVTSKYAAEAEWVIGDCLLLKSIISSFRGQGQNYIHRYLSLLHYCLPLLTDWGNEKIQLGVKVIIHHFHWVWVGVSPTQTQWKWWIITFKPSCIFSLPQSVSIHCHTSEPAPIRFGFPQRSVLWPVLFVFTQLLFINSIAIETKTKTTTTKLSFLSPLTHRWLSSPKICGPSSNPRSPLHAEVYSWRPNRDDSEKTKTNFNSTTRRKLWIPVVHVFPCILCQQPWCYTWL